MDNYHSGDRIKVKKGSREAGGIVLLVKGSVLTVKLDEDEDGKAFNTKGEEASNSEVIYAASSKKI